AEAGKLFGAGGAVSVGGRTLDRRLGGVADGRGSAAVGGGRERLWRMDRGAGGGGDGGCGVFIFLRARVAVALDFPGFAVGSAVSCAGGNRSAGDVCAWRLLRGSLERGEHVAGNFWRRFTVALLGSEFWRRDWSVGV